MPSNGGKLSLVEDLEKLLETARTMGERYSRADGTANDEITRAGLRVLWNVVMEITALHNAVASCKSVRGEQERELKLRPVGVALGSKALPLLDRVIEARDLPHRLKQVAKEEKEGVKQRDANTIAQAAVAAVSPRPVLDLFKYDGYACVQFDEETGSVDESAERKVSLRVWFQEGPVEQGLDVRAERIEIREGIHVDPVPFEIVIDSDTLEITPARQSIGAPLSRKSGEAHFECCYHESGPHDVWVQFNQQNRLIQVVKTAFDTKLLSVSNG